MVGLGGKKEDFMLRGVLVCTLSQDGRGTVGEWTGEGGLFIYFDFGCVFRKGTGSL